MTITIVKVIFSSVKIGFLPCLKLLKISYNLLKLSAEKNILIIFQNPLDSLYSLC